MADSHLSILTNEFSNSKIHTKFSLDKSTSFEEMFSNCVKLDSIDLSFSTGGNSVSTRRMFLNCENLQTIIVNHTDSPQINIVNFDSGGEYYASTLTDKNIFPNCESLQGGNGTQWTSDTKDYTYFQADLPNQVGLLTYQAAQGGN